jgi:hypothetical protein
MTCDEGKQGKKGIEGDDKIDDVFYLKRRAPRRSWRNLDEIGKTKRRRRIWIPDDMKV